MGFPYRCKFCEYEGDEFDPKGDWEVNHIKCPACGAEYFVEKEILYHTEIESKPTKDQWEIDEFFDPSLKKERLKRERQEKINSLSPAKKLGELGKKQKNKLVQYF